MSTTRTTRRSAGPVAVALTALLACGAATTALFAADRVRLPQERPEPRHVGIVARRR